MSLFILSGISLGHCTWKMWVNFITVASYCLSKRHQIEQGYYNQWVYPKSSSRAKLSKHRGAWTRSKHILNICAICRVCHFANSHGLILWGEHHHLLRFNLAPMCFSNKYNSKHIQLFQIGSKLFPQIFFFRNVPIHKTELFVGASSVFLLQRYLRLRHLHQVIEACVPPLFGSCSLFLSFSAKEFWKRGKKW